jgi:hypothetical protein
VNIDQLGGADLDYWTARAEGHTAELISMHGLSCCRIDVYGVGYQVYQPTENWLLAGEIARRRHYTQYPRRDRTRGGGAQWVWLVETQQNPNFHAQFVDPEPRIAICRLRVAEALAAHLLIGGAQSLPTESACVLEARALAAMSGEQCELSYLRSKNFRRHADQPAVQLEERS